MKKSTNSITINGHIYDALTGVKIGRPSIDGILPAKHGVDVAINAAVVTAVALGKPAKSTQPALQHKLAHKATILKPNKLTPKLQPSKTLMRHVVHRPDVSRPYKAVSAIAVTSKSSAGVATLPTVAQKRSASVIHPQRATHAAQVQKSQSITKFGATRAVANHHQPDAQSALGSVVIPHTVQPAVFNHTDMFQSALERATSHQQTLLQRPKNKRQAFMSKRRFSAALTAVTMLLLIGLVGYTNRAALGLKMAERQAGIHAELPRYQPSGFSVSKVKASAGTVAIHYASNSDNRSFALTEKASQWDSATLRDSYVLAANKTYQTLQIGGRTVYLYGNKEASWVNGGIWYQMKTNGALSSQQISQIALSL